MEPNWSQNRTQDGPKSKIKTRSKKEDLEDRLGAVLGRSWVVLGAVLGSSWGRLGVVEWGFAEAKLHFLTNDVFEKVRLQEATWTDLGPIWGDQEAPKWRPRRSKSEVS